MIRATIGGIEVYGFRRFQEKTPFSFAGPDGLPPSTLIVAGPNGCGKTTFFEAILYALGREGSIHRELRDEDRERWFLRALAPDAYVRLTAHVASAPGTILGTRTPCSLEVFRSLAGWQLRAGADMLPVGDDGAIRALLAEISVEWFSSWRQPYLAGAVRPMAQTPEFAHAEAGRLWQLKQRIVDERTRSAFTLATGRDGEWLERLSRAWSALRGEDGTRLGVGAANSDASNTHFDLYVQRTSREMDDELVVCSVDQLSSGELEWLALVGTLITKDFEGILLIDEPELHLHPEWQARLLPALRAVVPETQLVLATHADPPWDQVYSFERVLLVPPDDPRAQEIK